MSAPAQEIIYRALCLFSRYGIRSVTMDDVARELSISKKTIYKHFENKADLVHQSLQTVHDQIYQSLMELHRQHENAIDELFAIDEVVRNIMENHDPGLRYQLKKFYPATFNYLYAGRQELIQKVISENIVKGKKAGLYRSTADTEICTYLYGCKVETLPEEEDDLFHRKPIPFVMRQALEYHIRAIASPAGLEYLEQKLKEYNP